MTTATLISAATPQSLINSASGGGESILDKIWDFASNKFDRGLEYVLDAKETERLIKLRQAEAQAEQSRTESLLNLNQAAASMRNMDLSANLLPIVVIGGLGLVAAFLILK